MEGQGQRGSLTKWLLFGLAILLFWTFGRKAIFGDSAVQLQPLTINDSTAAPAESRPAEQICEIKGDRFDAKLSSRGGSLRSFVLTDAKYHQTEKKDQPIDMVTTGLESRMPLRTDLRLPGGSAQQVPYDDLDWKLAASDGKSCTFTYEDGAAPAEGKPTTRLTKTVRATGKPFELEMALKVENLAPEAKNHRLTVEQTAFRYKKETEGHLGLMSEHLTETVAKTNQETVRSHPDAFDPDDFKGKGFTDEKWLRAPGEAKWVATSSSYFTSLAVPVQGPAAPYAESQIEEYWNHKTHPKKDDDPAFGHAYRARLAYPERELKPGESASYEVLAYLGPKERDVLAHFGGGQYDVSEVINLGWFAVIGKVLISYIYFLHRLVGSWGWAICLLTISVKLALFPLSLTQIKSSVAMRKLKPEMDEINAKYKDDVAQRGLAMQELWRKHGVSSPVMGCIPVMLQMPVWFALYTALQTAVELYHTPFGPVIPDLSQPGLYYIIPAVLGISSLIQQRIMPPQGDPAQQKMMMYMMPAIFTFMMLFLPAGLGVYMLTNTWLGIGQQLLVERYLKAKSAGPAAGIEVREKKPSGDDDDKPSRVIAEAGGAPALGKGKARVRG